MDVNSTSQVNTAGEKYIYLHVTKEYDKHIRAE
jgi:hypothetical protein